MMASRTRYRWIPERGTYRDLRTGRYVSSQQVRRAIDATLRNMGADVRRLADDLRAGRISVDRWHLEMRQRIRDTHLLSAAAARGGFANLDFAAYGQVGGVIAEQDRYLDGFVADLRSGQQKMTASLSHRATQYVERGRNTHERAKRDVDVATGKGEEINRLKDAQHCGECPSLTALGWVPAGTLPLPGDRECHQGCVCEIIRR